MRHGVPGDVIRYSRHSDGQHFSEFGHASMATVDGILYRSRFTECFCVAVYDRAAHRIAATTRVPLTRPLGRGSLTDWNVDGL